MRYFRRFFCLMLGHDFYVLFFKLNEHGSAWGAKQCNRCDHSEQWNWDW